MRAALHRRLLFIVYEFPPSAGGGASRAASFARFLPEGGWDVTVLSAEPVLGQPTDNALAADLAGVPVTRLPARHVATGIAHAIRPIKRLLQHTAARPTGAASLSGAMTSRPVSTGIARWIAIPDDAVVWGRSVPRAAAALHADLPFDAVLASGPPYSSLVAGVRVAEQLELPVVLDLRDPWRDNANLQWPTRLHARCSEALEREAIGRADAVSVAFDAIAGEVSALGATRIEVIPNGFDPSRMPVFTPSPGPLRLAFLGRFSPGYTDPGPLFEALARTRALRQSGTGITLDVYGPDAPWAADAARAAGVSDAVAFHGFRPYPEALSLVARADIGLVVLADVPGAGGVLPGKMFDYIGIGIPVLVFGPEGAAAELARESGGFAVRYGDVDALAAELAAAAERKHARGTLEMSTNDAVRARFDRRAQVARVSALLGDAIGARS